jgi:protein-disulfide isomerase
LRQPKRPKRFGGIVTGGTIVALLAIIGLFGMQASDAPAADKDLPGEALTPEQEAEVLGLFKRYLSEHPEDIYKALESHAANQQNARENQVQQTLAEGRLEIEQDEGSFVGGNVNGDISLVEFFDYRCSYCKKAHNVVRDLLEQDGNIRFVYKEFPILGPDSVLASQAALASRKQGKYLAFHNALMSAQGSLNLDRIFEIAEDTGVNVARLETDMKDPEINEIIGRNHALAQKLNIGGTPAFVVGDQLLAGMADIDRFKALVEEARTSCKSC